MRTVSVAAAALLVAGAAAHPVNELALRTQTQKIADIEKYRLTQTSEFTSSRDIAKSGFAAIAKNAGDYVSTAKAVVKKAMPNAEYRMAGDHYVGSNGVAHVHFKQQVNGIDIANADFNVNIAKDGSVLSFGNSFYKGQAPANAQSAKSDPVAALKGVNDALKLGLKLDKATAKQADGNAHTFSNVGNVQGTPDAKRVYFQKDGKLVDAWKVETDLGDDWLVSYIDAATNKDIQGVVNYKADAQYEVFPWGINDPTEGGRETLTDPWDKTASPKGWQNDGKKDWTVTRGNNGIAQTNPSGGNTWENNPRPDAGANLSFVYPVDLTAADPKTNMEASVTQLFYTANFYHDLLYHLGFDEKAGNFEEDGSRGGKGGDAVILNAQDGSGTNNANFATPPDGQRGRMRMYIWDTNGTPKRDCTFESGVVIHEYTHGVSNRLTGGPDNTECLSDLEAGGMGEGWGDFMATAIRTNSSDNRNTDQVMGAWVYNDPKGIRDYPYSTDMKKNPLTYKSLDKLNEVHAIGVAWTNTLYEIMWNLIDKHGNTDAAIPEVDDKGIPKDGRFMTMKLVIDGMALQPCQPNFIQARDAILDAEKAATGGSNACDMWKGFAKRGLGTGASKNGQRVESFDLPKECGGTGPTPTPSPTPSPSAKADAINRRAQNVRWA